MRPKTKNKRNKRLPIPLFEAELELIDKAAKLADLPRTIYARRLLIRRVEIFLEKQISKGRTLSAADSKLLKEHVDNPAAGNPKLQQAIEGIVQGKGAKSASAASS